MNDIRQENIRKLKILFFNSPTSVNKETSASINTIRNYLDPEHSSTESTATNMSIWIEDLEKRLKSNTKASEELILYWAKNIESKRLSMHDLVHEAKWLLHHCG